MMLHDGHKPPRRVRPGTSARRARQERALARIEAELERHRVKYAGSLWIHDLESARAVLLRKLGRASL